MLLAFDVFHVFDAFDAFVAYDAFGAYDVLDTYFFYVGVCCCVCVVTFAIRFRRCLDMSQLSRGNLFGPSGRYTLR